MRAGPTQALALLAAALLLLTACAPSHRQVLRAEHLVTANLDHALSCRRADHCAQPSALRELGHGGDPAGARNHAIVLELGEDALIARLNLIRAARRSIDIQTFIWARDDAGLLVLDELVRAARRGVRVRVLADQLGSFKDVELLATLARAHVNFELRLYNPILHAGVTGPLDYVMGALCCFYRANQRMHNKLLLIDGRVGITGGRNYENKYFDWDSEFNFLDRDVLVAGPVTAQMHTSFERFWAHPRSVPLVQLADVNARLIADGPDAPNWKTPAYAHPERIRRVLAAAVDPAYIRRHFTLHAHVLDKVRYFSDLPGKSDDEDRAERELTAHLMELLATADREIVLQTPYLVLSKRAQRIFRRLARERPHVRILVSTNSLASTDAFAVYALAHKYVRRYLAVFNFNLYEQKPHPVDAPRMIAHYRELSGQGGNHGADKREGRVPLTTGGVRLSLHAKSLVVDQAFVMIGSHNFDPRSNELNTESGIIAADPAFARIVRRAILANIRPGNSWVIVKREVDGLLGRVNRALAKLSAQLPIFDLWPFGYATSWELKDDPDCPVMLREDPRFYSCYVPVGEFPEVALPLKTIYTRIITAFGGGFSGML